MKIKILLLACLFALGCSTVNAQMVKVKKGQKILNLGIGFGSSLGYSSVYKTTVPAISGSLEVIVKDGLLDKKASIGVGGYVGFSSGKTEVTVASETFGYKYTNFIIGPRGYFHYQLVEKIDTYAGLLIGYWAVSSQAYGGMPEGYDGGSFGGVRTAEFVGARYYFNKKYAAMLELGYGISYANIGLTIKL
ncbi:MAG: hypothetical protein WCR72_12450 [Bacteroidota bacterium]